MWQYGDYEVLEDEDINNRLQELKNNENKESSRELWWQNTKQLLR